MEEEDEMWFEVEKPIMKLGHIWWEGAAIGCGHILHVGNNTYRK